MLIFVYSFAIVDYYVPMNSNTMALNSISRIRKRDKMRVCLFDTPSMDTYRVKLTASCSPDELAGPVLCEFTETSI